MRQCEFIEKNDLPCGKPVFGTDRETGIGYCHQHQWKRTDIKKAKTTPKQAIRQRKPIQVRSNTKQREIVKPAKRFKPTGEAVIFHDIWRDREHVSFISGLPLDHLEGTSMWYSIFSHVLAKGQNKYPKFKLYPDNIQMLTPYEHHIFDNGTEEERQEYAHRTGCDWHKLYDLADILKEEYKTA